MAKRVKKLAKELGRSPQNVLGLLHALGYTRFQSVSDMVSDAVVGRLERGIRDGLTPSPVLVPTRPSAAPKAAPPSKSVAPKAEPAPLDVPLDRWVGGNSPPVNVAQAERRDVERKRLQLDDAEDALRQRNRQLEAERDRLVAEKALVEAERDTLRERERQADARDRAHLDRDPPTLIDVLRERGLRGRDEEDRAILALAKRRILADVLRLLSVEHPRALASLLKQRLVLVGAEDAGLELPGVATIAVSDDRAELPGPARRRALVERVAELALLHGLTRVCVMGGPPHWLRMLRDGFDPRIDLMLRNDGGRAASADALAGFDMVIFWGPVSSGDESAQGTSTAIVVRYDGPDLAGLVIAIEAALRD